MGPERSDIESVYRQDIARAHAYDAARNYLCRAYDSFELVHSSVSTEIMGKQIQVQRAQVINCMGGLLCHEPRTLRKHGAGDPPTSKSN